MAAKKQVLSKQKTKALIENMSVGDPAAIKFAMENAQLFVRSFEKHGPKVNPKILREADSRDLAKAISSHVIAQREVSRQDPSTINPLMNQWLNLLAEAARRLGV